MKTLVKKLAFVLIGTIVSISIHAQSANVFTTPIEIKQGQYDGADLYEDGKLEDIHTIVTSMSKSTMLNKENMKFRKNNLLFGDLPTDVLME